MRKRLIDTTEITRKVDSRGRVSLPEELANSHVVITKTGDGTYTLQQVELVPKATAWLWKNPDAQAMIKRGLSDAAEGRLTDFDPSEEDVSWLPPPDDEKDNQ